MPIKPFFHETNKRPGHRRRIAQRHLVFDHHVHHRMKLGILDFHPSPAVIVDDEVDALRFIEIEPGLGMRSSFAS